MSFLDVLYLALSIAVLLVAGFIVPVLRRLADTIGSADSILKSSEGEIIGILKRLQTSQDGINKELERVDSIVQDVQGVTDKVEATTRIVGRLVGEPIARISGLASALAASFGGKKKR